MNPDVVCRGSWTLGSACGECSRCKETLPGFIGECRQAREDARALRSALLATLRAWKTEADQGDGITEDNAFVYEQAQMLLGRVETCERCGGVGRRREFHGADDNYDANECPVCGGTGLKQ